MDPYVTIIFLSFTVSMLKLCNYFRSRFLTITFGDRNLSASWDLNSSIAAKPAIIGSAMYIHRRMFLASFSTITSTKRTMAHIIEFLLVVFMLLPPSYFAIIISDICFICISNVFMEQKKCIIKL